MKNIHFFQFPQIQAWMKFMMLKKSEIRGYVKMAKYNTQQNEKTWEPIENLTQVKEQIKEFEKQLGLQRQQQQFNNSIGQQGKYDDGDSADEILEFRRNENQGYIIKLGWKDKSKAPTEYFSDIVTQHNPELIIDYLLAKLPTALQAKR
ncbi:hypothetical protein pb186bvf_009489 [Paramecium bursaria]